MKSARGKRGVPVLQHPRTQPSLVICQLDTRDQNGNPRSNAPSYSPLPEPFPSRVRAKGAPSSSVSRPSFSVRKRTDVAFYPQPLRTDCLALSVVRARIRITRPGNIFGSCQDLPCLHSEISRSGSRILVGRLDCRSKFVDKAAVGIQEILLGHFRSVHVGRGVRPINTKVDFDFLVGQGHCVIDCVIRRVV